MLPTASHWQNATAVELQRSFGVGRLSAGVLDGKTRVKLVYQEGALKLRFPRRAFGADLDAVIINTAGGLTGGDRFEFHADIQSGADVTLATQACERIYRSIGPSATYDIDLSVAADARLFWAPQETIFFDRARFRRRLNVDLAPGADFLALESVIWGRTDMGEDVVQGAFDDRWTLKSEGRPIHVEAVKLDGAVRAQLDQPAIANGDVATATLLHVSKNAEEALKACRQTIAQSPKITGGASYWPVDAWGKLLIRLTAPSGYELRKALLELMIAIRGTSGVPRSWGF